MPSTTPMHGPAAPLGAPLLIPPSNEHQEMPHLKSCGLSSSLAMAAGTAAGSESGSLACCRSHWYRPVIAASRASPLAASTSSAVCWWPVCKSFSENQIIEMEISCVIVSMFNQQEHQTSVQQLIMQYVIVHPKFILSPGMLKTLQSQVAFSKEGMASRSSSLAH